MVKAAGHTLLRSNDERGSHFMRNEREGMGRIPTKESMLCSLIRILIGFNEVLEVACLPFLSDGHSMSRQ